MEIITEAYLPVGRFYFKERYKVEDMAKTKSSVRGEQQKKIVVVKPYKRGDGTKVSGHRRSTPN